MLRVVAWTLLFLADGWGAPRTRPVVALLALAAAVVILAWAFPAALPAILR